MMAISAPSSRRTPSGWANGRPYDRLDRAQKIRGGRFSGSEARPMTYRLDHIALLVRALDESVRFLTEVIGLAEIATPMGGTAIRWIEIGDGRRFHVQAGDISRLHIEKQ